MTQGSAGEKNTGACEVHGAPARTANRTLIGMLLVSFALIVWHVWVYGPGGHAVPAESAPASFPILLGNELRDLLFGKHGIVAELWDVFPYFLVGVLLAGYLRTYKIAVKLQAKLRRYGIMSVVVASFVGIITPLCACGTLTTAISLLFAGIPLAPVMAILVTSPLMSPSTYLLTLNDLGSEWTVIRTVAAFSMGIFAGLVTHFLKLRGFDTKDIFVEGGIVRGDFHDEDYPDERLRCNCKEKFGNRVAVRTDSKFVIFLAKSAEMVWTVGKYVLVGVAIGAVVERYMPYEWIYRLFGRKDPLNIVWITLGSVPIFLHQISGSSILYHIKSSLHGTLDGGAGLAFMIGGPVTAIPTMVMFWTFFKRRVFYLYLFVCLAGTLLIAYTFSFFVFVPGVDTGNPLLKGIGSITGGTASVIAKQNDNVRIVLDPADKPLLATYSNDLGKDGGVICAGGGAPFLDASLEQHGNRRFIDNIAAWLEQSNTSAAKEHILICDLSGADGRDGAAPGKRLAAVLEQRGIKVRMTSRSGMPVLSAGQLAPYSQLWLFFGRAGSGSALADKELKAVADFTGDGRGLLLVAPPRDDGGDLAEANRLSSRYGITFSGRSEHGAELPIGVAAPLFNRAAEVLGRLLKLTHKA